MKNIEKNIECIYCGKMFSKYGIKNHISVVHEGKLENVQHFGRRKIEPWNKGLTKETDSRIKSYSQKISKSLMGSTGRTHSQETKTKISNARKLFLSKNPDKIPYLLNHSSKESYPEKYFNKILENEILNYQRYLNVSIYNLDFAFIDKGIDLEIDGEQHYSDENIIKSNKNRDIFLTQNGWKVIRIKWSDFKKLSFKDKQIFIKDLIIYLTDSNKQLPNLISNINYCKCGKKLRKSNKMCRKCYDRDRKKVHSKGLEPL